MQSSYVTPSPLRMNCEVKLLSRLKAAAGTGEQDFSTRLEIHAYGNAKTRWNENVRRKVQAVHIWVFHFGLFTSELKTIESRDSLLGPLHT
jgi:hypothetical protein